MTDCPLQLAEPLATSPPQTYYLSSSYADILAYLGLSFERWSAGFTTQDALFAWLTSCPCANVLAARYRAPDYVSSSEDDVGSRPLRRAFIRYLQTCVLPAPPAGDGAALLASADPEQRAAKLDAALRHFGKAEEHAALLATARAQLRSREILNGTNVQAWTGVMGMPVRLLMDEVKERL